MAIRSHIWKFLECMKHVKEYVLEDDVFFINSIKMCDSVESKFEEQRE